MKEPTPKDLGFLVWDKVEHGRLFLLPDPKCWAGPATGQQDREVSPSPHDQADRSLVNTQEHFTCHQHWEVAGVLRGRRGPGERSAGARRGRTACAGRAGPSPSGSDASGMMRRSPT